MSAAFDTILFKIKRNKRIATSALEIMASPKTDNDFSDSWYSFLTAGVNIFQNIEEAHVKLRYFPKLYEEMKKAFSADPLLDYIKQARNDDVHGLNIAIATNPGGLFMGAGIPGFEGFYLDEVIKNETGFSFERLADEKGRPVIIQNIPPHISLRHVKNRKGDDVPVPLEHLGRPLPDVLPITIARLADNYFAYLVNKAEKEKPS